jgi:hypothetical protein
LLFAFFRPILAAAMQPQGFLEPLSYRVSSSFSNWHVSWGSLTLLFSLRLGASYIL